MYNTASVLYMYLLGWALVEESCKICLFIVHTLVTGIVVLRRSSSFSISPLFPPL